MKAFLVRLWTAGGIEEPTRALRGVVEPVGEGEATPFRDERELLEVLYGELARVAGGDPAVGARPGPRDD